MKERNFYSDDFEQLIREKTEQYKMYPSERVWKGVHNSLHTKRRWFIGSMSLLVTGILFLAGKELISPSTHPIVARKLAATAASVVEAPKPWLAAHVPHASHTVYHSANALTTAARHNEAGGIDPVDDQDPTFKDISITLTHPVVDPSDLSGWMNHMQLPDHVPEIAVIAAHPVTGDARVQEDGLRVSEDGLKAPGRAGAETVSGRETGDEADADGLSARAVLESLGAKGVDPTRGKIGVNGRLVANNGRNGGNGVTADGALSGLVSNSHRASAAAIAEAQDRDRVNWLYDYALNTLPSPSNRGRTYFQLYLSPTVSYRTFNGGDAGFEKTGPTNNNTNTNPSTFTVSPPKLKNNSAAFGFQFGGSILYRLTRNLTVKGGLQINFARFRISTIAITDTSSGSPGTTYNTYWGYVSDSMHRAAAQQGGTQSQSTNVNTPVYSVQTLNNDYLTLSAPVGFELRVIGNERLQFNLGATIQPSYLLSSTAYMMDPDKTKYSRDLQKYRKWNLNTGVEAFLSYRTGSVRWQVGPEFRYQMLSTYTSQYPFSENLKTYGLKIGITKMLP